MNTEYANVINDQISRLNADTGLVFTYGTTGGNCDAYFMEINTTDYYMITIDASAPITAEDWENVTIGFYSEQNNYDPSGYVETNYNGTIEFFTSGMDK